jgi:hypothetical protein
MPSPNWPDDCRASGCSSADLVQLHALERGATHLRVTADIDVLGQARPQGTLNAIDEALRAEGFELIGPDLDGYAHRYRRAHLTVDVLSPEGIRPPATIGGLEAVGVPGGTQALGRAEDVTVSVGGRDFQLRRPTLLGAILIKASPSGWAELSSSRRAKTELGPQPPPALTPPPRSGGPPPCGPPESAPPARYGAEVAP